MLTILLMLICSVLSCQLYIIEPKQYSTIEMGHYYNISWSSLNCYGNVYLKNSLNGQYIQLFNESTFVLFDTLYYGLYHLDFFVNDSLTRSVTYDLERDSCYWLTKNSCYKNTNCFLCNDTCMNYPYKQISTCNVVVNNNSTIIIVIIVSVIVSCVILAGLAMLLFMKKYYRKNVKTINDIQLHETSSFL